MTIETMIEITAPGPGYDVEVLPEYAAADLVYVARHPALRGCMSHGATPDEAMDHLAEARELYLAALDQAGIPRPAPTESPLRTVLRMLPPAEGREPTGDQTPWRISRLSA